MTFYEAALRVLEEAKRPLTHGEITQISVEKGLLSHVGKTPELTMLSRLAAMAKRPRDRKVIITAKDTFALAEWMLPEDEAASAVTGIVEPNPEEDLPPYRPVERHPEPRSEYVRAIGRQAERERKSRRDDERRRKYPPIAEVAFETLTELGSLAPNAVLEAARKKELVSDELSMEQLLHALIDDNQRRIDSGRRPQFRYGAGESGELSLSLDASETPGVEIQAAFCAAAGVAIENGRPQVKTRGEARVEATALSAEDAQLITAAKHAGKEAKRAMARVMRKKLSEVDSGTLEKSIVRLMHELSFREVKVAKRGKEGPLLTARRREGSLELRYAVRILKGSHSIERRHVQDLRRDLGHYAAHVGLICSPGDARGDARSEALERGAMVFLWCGEGLADQFFAAHVGVNVQTVELYEIDEAFFAKAQVDAEAAKARREERHRERDRQDAASGAAQGEAGAERPQGGAPAAAEGQPFDAAAQGAPGSADAGDDEGDEAEEGEAGEGGEGQSPGAGPVQLGPDGQPLGRRRRRRRRRRGRGQRPEGAPGAASGVGAAAPGAPGAMPGGEGAGADAPPAAAPVAAAPAPTPASMPPAPVSGGDAGQ